MSDLGELEIKAASGRYVDVKEQGAIVRKRLAKEFPGVKFSVRISRFSGGSGIDVSYHEGPDLRAVEAVLGDYDGKGFDGSIDLAYSRKHWLYPDGSASIAEDPGTLGNGGGHPFSVGDALKAGAELVNFATGFLDAKQSLDFDADWCKEAYDAIDLHFSLCTYDGQRLRLKRGDDQYSRHGRVQGCELFARWMRFGVSAYGEISFDVDDVCGEIYRSMGRWGRHEIEVIEDDAAPAQPFLIHDLSAALVAAFEGAL